MVHRGGNRARNSKAPSRTKKRLLLVTLAGIAISASVYAGTITYTYDNLGRVKTATYPDGSVASYSYDSADNRVLLSTTIPAPTATNASITTPYGTLGTTALAPSGRYTGLAVATAAAHGSASISGTTASYMPNSGYYGADSFTYTATGPGGTSSAATVSVTVGTPAAPTANSASIGTAYNTAGSTSLTIGGVYSSTALAAGASHGTASVSGTTASYTPNSGYYGSDSFTYTATGPGGTSAPATVTVSVATPGAPSAGNASISTGYNTAGSTSLSISGVYSSTALASGASHGTASVSGTTASYTPNSGYYGSDSFTYTATGPGGTSSAATVTVSVANPATPVASNASISTGYNTAGSTSLSISGVYSSTALAAGASHGTASISGTTASYTPNAGYYGADSFTYTATGPGGTSSPATVSVTVATPAAPTAGNASLSSSYNGSGSAALSPSGVYTSLAVASNPSHGSASISGTTATYTPTSGYYGSDSFTYTATGPGGTSSAATVAVSVATPAAPTAGNDSLTVNYNTAGSVGLSPSGVYTSLAVASGPSHGSASISGTTATYTPTSGYSGSDSFTYTVSGPGGTSSPATVSVTVQPNPVVTINVTSASNLRTLANNNGYGGASGVSYQFVVPSGTTVEGAAGSGQAIATGTWPSGVTLSLVVSGNVYGGGGNGGNGTCDTMTAITPGSSGGDAVYVQAPLSVTVNSGGSIKGGGGGGFPDGSGGAGSSPPSGFSATATTAGSAGTTSGGGAAGTGGIPGGTGGGAAAAGSVGGSGNAGSGAAGGAAGYAIHENGNSVSITNNGTITGTEG